jgi:ribosomal protein S18 acetylase RimI-like enzyme
VGTVLIEAVKAVAREGGCKRVWLITTNDNVDALRFYQRRDFRRVGVARNAVEESRKIKPQISATGLYGIPIRDEIELEVML